MQLALMQLLKLLNDIARAELLEWSRIVAPSVSLVRQVCRVEGDGDLEGRVTTQVSAPLAIEPQAAPAAPAELSGPSVATAALFVDAPFAPQRDRSQQVTSPAAAAAATASAAPDAAQRPTPPKLVTADDYAAFLAPVFGAQVVGAAPFPAEQFVRQEPMEVLEAKLKAARPALLADFRSKQRTVHKKERAMAREKQ